MDEERRYELLIKGIDAGVGIVRTVIWAAVVVAALYYAQVVLVAWAGKSTEADISLRILTQLQADRWFAYMFGASGVGYGFFERKLRQRNIKRLSAHNAQLETRLDPKRMSSGLTPAGTTRKGD